MGTAILSNRKETGRDVLLFTAATVLSVIFSRREYYFLSGFSLIFAAIYLYLVNAKREGQLLNLPGLFALGLIGGEGVSCFHLSRLSTVWTRETWLSFYLGYLCFYLFYWGSCRLGERKAFEKSGERQAEKSGKGGNLRFLGIAIAVLTLLCLLCFGIEAVKLRFIPFFTVDTPHAYSTFHLPGVHYFTTLVVLIPSMSVLYLAERVERGKEVLKWKKGILRYLDFLVVLGMLLPWLLTILMVSRFQFLFSVILMLFTAHLRGFRLEKWQIAVVILGMLMVYVRLTVARAHSVSYLNEIFEMKNPNTPIFITQPYMYIANNYDNFNLMTEQLTVHSRGMRMLYPFVTLSSIKYFVELPLAYPLFVTKEELTTVTVLYDAWYDFALPGVLLLTAVLGMLSAWLMKKMRKTENPFGHLIKAQLCFYLLFSFFTTWFSNPATVFYIGISVILYFLYDIFKKYERNA